MPFFTDNLNIGDIKTMAKTKISELPKKRKLKHGMINTAEYHAWEAMIQRCENPKHPNYKHYGGRGINVCMEWHDFRNFFADVGKRPRGLTLERRDNNGHYTSKNCMWATWEEQLNNQRAASCGPNQQHWFRAWHKNTMAQFISKNQSEFARKWGLSIGDLSLCLHGKRKTHKGWNFRRINEGEINHE